MRFRSTGASRSVVDLRTALLEGLARDGGLYMPTSLPRIPSSFFAKLSGTSLTEIGCEMAAPFIEELEGDALRELVSDALDFPIPLRPLDRRNALLELFHGPTLAFKDVGARFLARLLSRLHKTEGETITILVATSGDTGGAVAQAFHEVQGIRVAVLFPRGKVSPVQEKQFSALGENVRSLAVDGSFDDCQQLVKAAFGDAGLRGRMRLSSANSINIGRLLPQSLYYAYALAQLPAGTRVLFSTPSGNFGNLTAGLIAREMGLPCEGFVAATNSNDAVPRYLQSGRFEPRATIATISNAMDVGNPSNFTRILELYSGDHGRIRQLVRGRAYDDAATRRCIETTYRKTGAVIDPHTAVGLLGLQDELKQRDEDVLGVVLATAHPAKFKEHVEPLIGTEIPLPPQLERCIQRKSQAVDIENKLAALVEQLDLTW